MGEDFPRSEWWDWWVEIGPIGAATWAGTIFSAIGLAVSIFGFFVAIRTAKRAADAATTANLAVEQLKASLGVSSLAYTHSQIGLLTQFVASKHFFPAHVLLATLKREILRCASHAQATENKIYDVKKRLKIISTHIGYAERDDVKFKAEVLNSALNSVQDMVIDWENSLQIGVGEVSK